MVQKHIIFRGAMMGMAVGDAMGYPVDRVSLAQIREDYGPAGLLGYDLVNGYAEVSSNTQIAAFAANGLLLGLTRGQMDKLVGYVGVALREWSRSQQFSEPARNYCWLSTVPQLRRRRCLDTCMLDALSRGMGTLEEPRYRSDAPTNLTAVIPLALLSGSLGISQQELDELGARIVVLTHGEAEAFLSGAVLTHAMSTLLRQPDIKPEALLQKTIDAVQLQFGRRYHQTTAIWELLQHAMTLASMPHIAPADAMEQLGCRTAPEVLAGVLYTCVTCGGDFDLAMITAVNHSGRSAVVGAIVGAVLGMCQGSRELPEFYLENLESAPMLMELADDLSRGCPADVMSRLFDDDWDRKYIRCGT